MYLNPVKTVRMTINSRKLSQSQSRSRVDIMIVLWKINDVCAINGNYFIILLAIVYSTCIMFIFLPLRKIGTPTKLLYFLITSEVSREHIGDQNASQTTGETGQ